MSNKDDSVISWRQLATNLQEKGLTDDEIFARIWRDYSEKFRGEESARRSVMRYLRSRENPGNSPKSFEDNVTEMKGSIRKRAERSKEREAVVMKAATDIIIDGILDSIQLYLFSLYPHLLL